MKRTSVFLKFCFFLACFSLASCQKNENVSIESISGEELFKAIYFGKGMVADKLPEVKYLLSFKDYLEDSEQIAIIGEVQENIFLKIKDKNDNFFKVFGEKIQSGDHIKIKAVLSEANNRIAMAAAEVASVSDEELEKLVTYIIKKYPQLSSGESLNRNDVKKIVSELYKEQSEQQMSKPNSRVGCLAGPLVVAIAVAGTVVIIVNVAAILNAVWAVTDVKTKVRAANDERTANPGLFSERLVNSIAENLKR